MIFYFYSVAETGFHKFTQKYNFSHYLLTAMSFQMCMTFLLLWNTKGDTCEIVLVFCPLMFLKISSFVFHRRKKVIQVWNQNKSLLAKQVLQAKFTVKYLFLLLVNVILVT